MQMAWVMTNTPSHFFFLQYAQCPKQTSKTNALVLLYNRIKSQSQIACFHVTTSWLCADMRECCIEEIWVFDDNCYCTKRHGCILRIGYRIKTHCPLIFMNAVVHKPNKILILPLSSLEITWMIFMLGHIEQVHQQSLPDKVKSHSSSRFLKLYLTKLIKLIEVCQPLKIYLLF